VIEHPIGVYSNWSSYDELSDQVELTEALAMSQLSELIRLKQHGVQIDYYVMDAFWFAKDGGYREWRKPHWLNGPDRWIQGCLENGIKPGMWFGANNPAWMLPIPAWMDSFDPQTGCMCCFYGGFLSHYLETLDLWYQRGIHMFKFDFADFNAAPPGIKESLLPSEIRMANVTAFRGALKAFRSSHPDCMLIAYNGFEERTIQNTTDDPFAKVVDTRWLEVFDSIYCGDPRPADVPTMNFWRSKDIYSDHMVHQYLRNDLPICRIDNAGFMIGTTGTCYYRGNTAWRGMLILSLARGGFVNTYYGNLDLLTDDDARWLARVQEIFFGIHAAGQTRMFGGLPGAGESYGYLSHDACGALVTVVNPSQQPTAITLPLTEIPALLFRDRGYIPVIAGNTIQLGAEQMALLGYGDYADAILGDEPDIHIPDSIEPVSAAFTDSRKGAIHAEITTEAGTRLRVVIEQRNVHGRAVRTMGGSPPNGQTLGKRISITARQGDLHLPVQIEYDKAIWSGLSWAVGEIEVSDGSHPVHFDCTTDDMNVVALHGRVYRVFYADKR
jgi:hypothetical protein